MRSSKQQKIPLEHGLCMPLVQFELPDFKNKTYYLVALEKVFKFCTKSFATT